MPTEKISMRRIQLVLRLAYESKLGRNKIVKATGMSRGSVTSYLTRAAKAGLSWPLPEDLDDAALDRLLFPPQTPASQCVFAPLDHPTLHLELKKPGVTLQLLWEEYRSNHPEGAYRYSQFCYHFRQWQARLQVTMRQDHKGGDKLFLDYCGPTVGVVNPATGEIVEAQVFVAVLGASNYTFAEATWTQTLQDWIASHQRALAFFGGVPALLVPDNLKSGVNKTNRFEPELNATYWAFAEHYGTAVLPARPYKPRDKAKVEAGVLVVERWIIARLRHQQFLSLAELNCAIAKLLADLNTRPFKKLEGCRRSLFESLDIPALRPLPAKPFEFFFLEKVRVGFNYHVEVAGHYYSVPYVLVKKQVEARITASMVEFLLGGKRVALHPRSFIKKAYSTIKEHMPAHHQAQLGWTPGRILSWANSIGPYTVKVAHHLLESRPHVQQAYNACLGLLSLSKRFSPTRLEAACLRAVFLETFSYKSVESMLKTGFDSQPLPNLSQEDLFLALPDHPNLRGKDYYAH